MQDDTSERGAPYRGRLKIVIADTPRELPPWADWLMALGEWMRDQVSKPGKRVVVVRLPVRSLASAFVGLGALCAAARLHDETLDWEALRNLPEGTPVHWRNLTGSRTKRHAGRVVGLQTMQGADCLVIDTVGSRGKQAGLKFYLSRGTALSYGVTLGAVSARVDEKLTAASRFMQALNSDSSLAWSRSPMADSTVVAERAGFLQDLEEIKVQAGAEPPIEMLDALSIADTQGRTHGKLLAVPTRTERIIDAPDGVTILDGAAAVSKLGQTRSRSVVVVLAHSEYDEEISHQLLPFLSYAIDDGVHPWREGARVEHVPFGVDVFAFGVRDQRAGEAS